MHVDAVIHQAMAQATIASSPYEQTQDEWREAVVALTLRELGIADPWGVANRECVGAECGEIRQVIRKVLRRNS